MRALNDGVWKKRLSLYSSGISNTIIQIAFSSLAVALLLVYSMIGLPNANEYLKSVHLIVSSGFSSSTTVMQIPFFLKKVSSYAPLKLTISLRGKSFGDMTSRYFR